MAKVAQFSVKVIKTSDDANTKIGLELWQGPDGEVFVKHSTVITEGLVPPEKLYVGDADTSKILNEFLRAHLTIASNNGNAQWAIVDVWQMTKPF